MQAAAAMKGSPLSQQQLLAQLLASSCWTPCAAASAGGSGDALPRCITVSFTFSMIAVLELIQATCQLTSMSDLSSVACLLLLLQVLASRPGGSSDALLGCTKLLSPCVPTSIIKSELIQANHQPAVALRFVPDLEFVA